MTEPFVGRRVELEALSRLVRLALHDRVPVAAVVTGVPGSGKSRLIRQFSRTLREPTIVRLVGFEPMQQVPLGAAGELLRHLSRVPGRGEALERLVFGDGELSSDPLRVFEAAHRALSASAPILIAIDDLQWVDERSVALVHYLLRSSVGRPLVVIALARPSPVAAGFRSTVTSDIDPERRVVIDLGPLSLDDGRSLARAIDARLDDVAALEVWRRAAGSPFWLETLARSHRREDPTGLIEERLRDLGPDAGALLSVLAVGARPFAERDLAEVLGWERERVRQASSEIVARGLALEAAGTIQPAHDLIREATIAGLPPAARRRLHAHLAAWLEATARADPPLLQEALEHRVAAGLPAAELAIRVLDSPQQRLIGADGLRLIAEISDRLDPGSSSRIELDRRIAAVAGVLGEHLLARERWRRVAAGMTDPGAAQRAWIEAARSAYRLRRADDAHADLERARSCAPASPASDVAMLALQADIELWLDHQTAAGALTADRSLAAALEMTAGAGGFVHLDQEAREASLAAHDVAIDAALQQDRAEDVVRLSEASVLVAEGIDTASHIASITRRAFGLRPLGRAIEAEVHYRQAWKLAQQHVLPTAMVEAGHGLARVLRDLGRFEESRSIATHTVELERRIGDPPRRWGNAPSILHLTEIALGDTARIETLREDARAEPDPHYRLSIHQAIAVWQARLSGPGAARSVRLELEAADAAAAEAGCPRCGRELLVSAAEALARIGHIDEARRALSAWEAGPSPEYLSRRVWRARARAAIALASGDGRTAAQQLEGPIAELRRAGLLEDLLWALLDVGAALQATDRRRAIDAYTEAANLADMTSARTHGRLAARALRRLGVRAWRRGRASEEDGAMPLSQREREVGTLVAEGRSNREIAEAIALSPKTIERHVTNILAKLGLRNRTELASHLRSRRVRDSPDE